MQYHVIADSQVIAASVGTTVGMLLLSTAIIIISLIIILYKKRQGKLV